MASPNGSPRQSVKLSSLLDPKNKRVEIGKSGKTAEQIERIDQILKDFREIDANGDGVLTFREIHSFLNKKASGFPEDTCLELFNQMDRDQNQEVTTKEFVEHYVMVEDSVFQKINEQNNIILDNKALLEENRKKLVKAQIEEQKLMNGIMKDSVLTVHVIEVMRFRLYNVGIFIELYCDDQIIETEPQPFDQNPVFKETFTFQIKNNNLKLKIALIDSKSKNKVAEGFYSLEELRDQLKKDVLVDVFDGKNDGAIGRVHLELQWIWSRIEYFKQIIEQIEDNLRKSHEDLAALEKNLKDLHKPFGIFDFRGAEYQGIQDPVSRKITNVFYGVLGRNIRWKTVLNGFLACFLVLSAFNMFFISDYLNVRDK
jgi:hypothetical protein